MDLSSIPTSNVPRQVKVEELPLTFKIKYIGFEEARGIWGIKSTRRPVDKLVAAAKNLNTAKQSLPYCNLTVSTDSVKMEITSPLANVSSWNYPINTISYGVQDLVYTRVFAMIVVKDEHHPYPFEVHAFVCDSRTMTRKLTLALAAAFQDYARRVDKPGKKSATDNITPHRQKFAIDLRTPEEQQQDVDEETDA